MTAWQQVDTSTIPSRTDQAILDRAREVQAKSRLLAPSDHGDAVRELIGGIVPDLPRKLAIMRDQEPGQPGAASYDGDAVKGGAGSDRTASVAMDLVLRGDRIAGDRARLYVVLLLAAKSLPDKPFRAHGALDSAAAILAPYGARPATAKERRDAAKANERHIDPGCESCARLPGHEPGVNRWEPIAPGREATDCGGILGKPHGLCSWCYRWVLDTDRLPSVAELATHHAGDKVRRPA